MRLGSLEYVAKDFEAACDCGPEEVEGHAELCLSQQYADDANRILREKIAKAPTTYSDLQWLNPGEADWEPLMDFDERKETPTHIARLVCIEETKKS